MLRLLCVFFHVGASGIANITLPLSNRIYTVNVTTTGNELAGFTDIRTFRLGEYDNHGKYTRSQHEALLIN